MKFWFQLTLYFNTFVAAFLLMSCDIPKKEGGPKLTESAVIYDTAFVPEGHGTGTASGYTSNGDYHYSTVKTKIPARYAVVFQCQHGKFIIDGDRGEYLYKKFSKGDKVIVSYQEEFEVRKESKTCTGLHFIDAVLDAKGEKE